MSRIILFGATGYTGTLTAHSLASVQTLTDDTQVVLAGRTESKLTELLDSLPLHHDTKSQFSTQVADVTDPASVQALVTDSTDVLISTVGPFLRWGQPAVAAAIEAGATYIDSTGESAFIRRLFDNENTAAKASGARLIPGFGYDFVPGNLAAVFALTDAIDLAGPAPSRVEIGYFISGGALASAGTMASAPGMILEPSYAFRNGKLRKEQTAKRTRTFDLGEKQVAALSIGGTEPFDLPAHYPSLENIGVYLGAGTKWTELASITSRAIGTIAKVPGVKAVSRSLSSRLVKGSAGGPDATERARSRSIAIAEVFDTSDTLLSRVVVDGPSPYDLTADLLAWAALNADAISTSGVHGPVGAFGLPLLTRGCASLDLVRATTN